MNIRTLLLRADASITTGTGHVMRCLALAQAWQDAGGRAVFAMAEATAALQARLSVASFDIGAVRAGAGTPEDARETIALGRELQCEWIVVDGYHFTADYQRALKSAGFRLLLLDDYGHASHYSADLVLNQNICAREPLYARRDPPTRLLLGPRYCLLRREFSAWRDWRREVSSEGRRVLVTMGGSDPENVTERVLQALDLLEIKDLEAIVVVGGSNPHFQSQERLPWASKQISLRRDVNNIAELMAWADVAVSSAGTTCWELCLLGLPSLLVDVAENQTALAVELARRHCAIHLGGAGDFTVEQLAGRLEELLRSAEIRQEISHRCRELVDGRGAQRVASAMCVNLRIRPAREDDCHLLWEWANDPQVRANAFSPAPIPWEQHKVWFASKMKDPDCRILVAENNDGKAVGQFRVNWRSDRDGDIDVSISSESRGAGYGAVLIELGASHILAERGERLHAFVKVENQASRRAFEDAGFTNLGEESVDGHETVHFVRSRERDQSLRSE